MDDDGQEWIVVGKRKRKMIEKEVKPEKVYTKGGKEQLNSEMMEAMAENFNIDSSMIHNKQVISSILGKNQDKQVKVHCLGLGNFLKNVKPYLQYLFLKHCVLEQLQHPYKCNIYDPIFTEEEKDLIKKSKFTCEPLKELQNNTFHLMFLPHCDRQLYELACRFKSQHNEVIIIGNSLKEYRHRATILSSQRQEEETKMTELFCNYFPVEIALKDYREALNDTFIYYLE